MTRRLVPTHAIDAAMSLLKQGDAAELFEDDNFESDLRVAIRVTLQGESVFEKLGDDPDATCSQDSSITDELDMLRDDIRAAMSLDAFQAVESTVVSIGGLPRVRWPWASDLSWGSVRRTFLLGVAQLRGAEVPPRERYALLLRLIRIQYVLFGLTLGMTADGFVE